MPLDIKRARRTVSFYPDQAVAAEIEAAQAALDAARDQVQKAKDDPARSLASRAVADAQKNADAAAKRLDQVREQAGATVLDVTLEALSRKRWAEVEENHPPREERKTDETFSLNWDTFLGEALPESVVDVVRHGTDEKVGVEPAEWVAALEEISDGQYQALAFAILGLNRSTAAPF